MGNGRCFLDINFSNALAVLIGLGGVSLSALFTYIFVYNIFLAVFNLLPAFPMDGGRIFRSLLAMRLEYVRATKIAATVGRGIAILMGIYGLFNGGIFMALIAVFIYSGATQEERMVKVRGSLRGYTVQQVVFAIGLPAQPVSQFAACGRFYADERAIQFPCFARGIIRRLPDAEPAGAGAANAGAHTWISDVMRRDVKPVTLSRIFMPSSKGWMGNSWMRCRWWKTAVAWASSPAQYSRTIPALQNRPRLPPQNATGVKTALEHRDRRRVSICVICAICGLVGAANVIFHIRFVNLPQFIVQIRR